jgi:hypothetical protein
MTLKAIHPGKIYHRRSLHRHTILLRGRVAVRVIGTDEEFVIARTGCRVLGLQGGKEVRYEDEED